MAKYSEEFKIKVVNEYLEGYLGYLLLAKKYNLSSRSMLERWVKAYQAFGLDGLRRKRTKEVFPVQFKYDVLHFMKSTGASYQETAIHFQMNNPSVIANWYRVFNKLGIEGLKDKVKGRPSMSKKPINKKVKQESTPSREEQLERENELLRLENAYLKKLKAFQENPNAFLAKHKQQWHSNSNKKDSN